ncbi:type II toxin-antitoxin system YafQ family toxin [Bifidobacterium jacchi]|uniref:Type II toxin-antitoxin system YafQ family toxin n=1 Tax=Bifidobacterium jacchi TaxID=2490545 RepID=A0A5N5RK11_9BIFI|nr:type II toxin-antitoxin system YafQ family toxin [Bifidobacterium jacchi]KAB5607071.1 type II toxin-antitoxin system YafQ family toxin [Bifidobacterium jacchi]
MAIEEIIATTIFDKDIKALRKKHTPLAPLWDAVDTIVADDKNLLSSKYKDRALTGQWTGFRELHIKGDWLLAYRIDGNGLTLVLTRTSTHDVLYSARMTGKDIDTYRRDEAHTIGKH